MKTTFVYDKKQGKVVEKFKAPVVIWHEPWSIESLRDVEACLDKIKEIHDKSIGVEGIKDYFDIIKEYPNARPSI